jgi:hypothetical protein
MLIVYVKSLSDCDLTYCRVHLYWIKATALRAAAPASLALGVRPWRADPVRRGR